MPIVMSLGFGEDGGAGDRGTVNRQATRGHEIYPGSGPWRENPTLACLLLVMAEPESTGVRRCNLVWRCVCGGKMMPSSLCPPSLYIEFGRSRAQIESVTSLGFAPLNILSVLVLLSKDPKMSWAWATRKSPQAAYILVGLPMAGPGMLMSCTRRV